MMNRRLEEDFAFFAERFTFCESLPQRRENERIQLIGRDVNGFHIRTL